MGPSLAGHFQDGMHVICVYTADCRDVEDLTRVLVRLRVLGFGGLLSYNEDGATLAGGTGVGRRCPSPRPARWCRTGAATRSRPAQRGAGRA